MLQSKELRAVSLAVISLQAQRGFTEPHVSWSVDYAPEPEDDRRVVFATLHAFDESGGGNATVAAMIEYPEDNDPSSEEFESALRDSEAVESLYDLARTVLRTVCATVDSIPNIETKAPSAEYGQLQKASIADEADSAATQSEEHE